jgi:hypothetical protein
LSKSNKSNFTTFFSDGLSVDETRVSVLMLGFVASLIFGGYMYLMTGAISTVWADIIITLILSVAGINAISTFVGGKSSSQISGQVRQMLADNIEKQEPQPQRNIEERRP